MTVAFESLNEAVHALEELSCLCFQRRQAGLLALHPLDQADFGLGQAADQVGKGCNLFAVLGNLLIMLGHLLVVLLHGRPELGLMIDDGLHGPLDIHSVYYSPNSGPVPFFLCPR